ncbi:MAG: DNA repair protein RadC [Euryarchaeota archaeon]|nr:DNA repair protein RadC [Euryarchaeota archaeon]
MTKQMRHIEECNRPREKIRRSGVSVLNDEELVATIIGRGTAGHDVMAISAEIVTLLKTGLPTFEKLTSIKGVGPSKAALFMACFEISRRYGKREDVPPIRITTPEDIMQLHEVYSLRHERQEHFVVITLNGAHEVINPHIISKGTLNQSLVHPREVFSEAIAERAAAIICVHNHPSGNLTPSAEDGAVTRQLAQAGNLLGIPLLDHIIISKNGLASLRELGNNDFV